LTTATPIELPPRALNRTEARIVGLKTFSAVRICPRDGSQERRVSDSRCMVCVERERATVRRAVQRAVESRRESIKARAVAQAKREFERERAAEQREALRAAVEAERAAAKRAAKRAAAEKKAQEAPSLPAQLTEPPDALEDVPPWDP